MELLTPPLPLDEAELVRTELYDAIYEIDGDFNFFDSDHTANYGKSGYGVVSATCTLTAY